MSFSQGGLHGDALLAALTETALEVQRARAVEEVLRAAGDGLARAGLLVGILSVDASGTRVRYRSRSSLVERIETAGLGFDAGRLPLHPDGEVHRSMREGVPLLLPAFRARMLSHLPNTPALVEVLRDVPDTAAVAPLHVRRSQWGAVLVLAEGLGEADLPALRLFALQLGSSIEVAEAFEELDRRTAELDLVHALAVAGPGVDSEALCHRALETACGTTGSDGGALYRFDTGAQLFVQVGEAVGYAGPLVEGFRRFAAPVDAPGVAAPLSGPVSQLPMGAQLLEAEGFRQVAIVPLRIEGKPVGLLSLARRADVAYSARDLRSAEILGVQMASLLERTRLYDEARRLYADLKKSYDELARTQQELVRHERLAALGELAAVMAHEVRNPLGVIFNSLTTLKRLMKPEGDAEMLLSIVGEEADRLNRIVGDLLDFVRPYELVKKPIAVEPVVASAVDAATQAALHHDVRVVTDFPKELPPFPLDAHLLKQALVNLIVNAAQAMPRGGTVQVRAATEPNNGQAWLCISVRDEGVGLTPRAAEKMFQPFFTTKATGTGLGLAVVKRIVDAHLGDISARPNDDGRGTTFAVRLPPSHDTRSGMGTPPRPSPSAPRR